MSLKSGSDKKRSTLDIMGRGILNNLKPVKKIQEVSVSETLGGCIAIEYNHKPKLFLTYREAWQLLQQLQAIKEVRDYHA